MLFNYLSMVLMALCWAGAFVVGKLSVGTVPPEMVAFLRFFIAGLVLVVWMAWKEPQSFRLKKRDWWLVIGLGVTGIAVYNLLFFRGLQYSRASDGAMIIPTLNPLLTMFVAAMLLGEALTPRKLTGAAISVVGQVLIFWTLLEVVADDPVRMRGDLFYVASSVFWSMYSVLGRVAAQRFTPLAATTWASLSGVLMIAPFALWAAPGSTGYTWGFWVDAVYLALGATVAGFVLWSRGVAILGASRAAVFINLVPVFTLLLSSVFLDDRPTALQVLGICVVLGGVYLSGTRPGEKAPKVQGESA
ncbi:MAG TPA: DMT family transporter [Symbiobacteriaceae bacterium]|nr:DMT family transporter [Symbiobacteriaceae bacterium]